MPSGGSASTVGARRSRCGLLFSCLLGVPPVIHAATDLSGYISAEPRVFFDAPAFVGQTAKGVSPSAVAAPEFRREWNDSNDRLTIVPFLRLDADDGERSHFDIREANWQHLSGPWTFRLGIGRVFWGVTESRHLVDIVNQTDQVEDVDEEDKLGQPMIDVEKYTEHGTFAALLLPGFRERRFSASDGRLRGPLPVATDLAVYESGRRNHRTDVALRWEQSLDRWDIGVSGFHGTGREPRLDAEVLDSGRTVLVPHYGVISQIGLDLQYTRGSWLAKLETIRRSGQGRTFAAYVAGFEYTAYAVGKTGADLGILMERLYDGRDAMAPATALANDVFIGARLTFNNVSDTMLLVGTIVDRDDRGRVGFIEGQRRLWERWRLEIELRLLDRVSEEALPGFRNDSFATFRLARFF